MFSAILMFFSHFLRMFTVEFNAKFQTTLLFKNFTQFIIIIIMLDNTDSIAATL